MRREGKSLTLAASGIGPALALLRNVGDRETDAIADKLFSQTKIIDNLPYHRVYRKDMFHTIIREGVAALGI